MKLVPWFRNVSTPCLRKKAHPARKPAQVSKGARVSASVTFNFYFTVDDFASCLFVCLFF